MPRKSIHANPLPVVIAGAGPYGLSIAAHLDEAGIPFRIFGGAMQMWREHMPVGMTMKSDGFASNLSAGRNPQRAFTFRQFCAERHIPYIDKHHPMPLEHFIAYGLEFQRRFVPHLDSRHIAHVEQHGLNSFRITLEDGETLYAGSFICATGLMHYPHLPPQLSGLPPDSISHSSAHTDFHRFSGKTVAVLGAGASAMHTAALLHESGANVTVVARRSNIIFHHPPKGETRPLLERLRHPSSQLGPGMRSWLSEKLPQAFHALPVGLREKIVQKHLGPSASGHLQDRVGNHARLLLGRTIEDASFKDGHITLTLNHQGVQEKLTVQHLIAATGYRVDVRRLKFLSSLTDHLRVANGAPLLNRRFESSVPGLYFVGVTAALSFGPLLRFAAGSSFAARTLTRTLQHQSRSSFRSFSFRPAKLHPGSLVHRLETRDDS